jgi:hypothetical protein
MDGEEVVMPPEPTGRYRRFVMDVEVELFDEDALQNFTFLPVRDAEGSPQGVISLSENRKVARALSDVAGRAWVTAEGQTGIRVHSVSGPFVRHLDEEGFLSEVTLPKQPNRRDDGTYNDLR